MSELPNLALSVRQPWAFCLASGWKDVENRAWRRGNPGLSFRGEFCIHASTGMTRQEYVDCAELCAELGFSCPAPADLQRGGIIGVATIVDVVTFHPTSPWFFGPVGLVIADPRAVEFIAVGGRLGFFDWRSLLPCRQTNAPIPPARWMLPNERRPSRLIHAPKPPKDGQGRLL
ncbi:MAG: hypothetical protein J0H53_05355 [Rhizobiales bacterium]|nr:hypothetical protein [Hyphomicrobiales bacterium]